VFNNENLGKLYDNAARSEFNTFSAEPQLICDFYDDVGC